MADLGGPYERRAELENQHIGADNVRWFITLILSIIATAALIVIAWKV